MVTEGAYIYIYGKLKGRWRVLYRKFESRVDDVKIIVLAVLFCIIYALTEVTVPQDSGIFQEIQLPIKGDQEMMFDLCYK